MDNKSHVPVTTDVRIFQQALESLDHGDLGIPHFRKLPFVAMETEEHHQTSNKQGMIGVVKTWNQMLQVPGAKIPLFQKIIQMWRSIPIGSMYAIYGNIYHQYTPNVSIYTIHGSYGIEINQFLFQKKTSESMESIGPSSNLQSFSRSPGLLDRKSLGDGSKAAGLPETRGQLSTLQGPRAAQLPGSG